MQKRETAGEAFRDGELVAAVVVTEQLESTGTEVLTPGSNRIGYRQRLRQGVPRWSSSRRSTTMTSRPADALGPSGGRHPGEVAMRDRGE